MKDQQALTTAAGGIVELRPLPLGQGLLAATQDCRLLTFDFTSLNSTLRTSTPSTTSKDEEKSNNNTRPGVVLPLHRQLIGNNDDVTDIRFLTAPNTTIDNANSSKKDHSKQQQQQPTHIVVSTNSEHIRVFDARSLSCAATLVGHSDIVLALDVMRLHSGVSLVASGSKDNSVRVWTVFPTARCVGK